MNIDELNHLILQGESETLEFKTSTGQLKEVGKTLSGFLNHKGGIVLIGVNEKNQIVGQHISDKTQQDIAQILNELTPSAPITWETCDLPNNDRKVIILKTNSPIPSTVFFFKGKPYERVGSTTHAMRYEHLRHLMLQRTLDKTWDQLPDDNYKIDDLDHDEIVRTAEDGIASGRLNADVVPKGDILGILRGLKLTIDGQLTKAAVVLFAKNMSSPYSHCEIKMAHFQGTTKTIGFFDERRYVGHAFNILREAETFARRHLNIAMKFNPNDLQREDIPQLPFLAIREALINAICHRDYIHNAGSISLAIFDDRLEIWNMGELPTPLQPNDLKIQHVSIPRNEKIAHAFYVRQYIEKWGSGTTRMMELCKELGVPEPEYTQYSGGFCVTFKFSEILDVSQPKEPLPIHITARQTRILDLLSEKARPLTLNEIATLIPDINVRLIRKELYDLKQAKVLETSGRGRGAIWFEKNNS